MSNLIWGTYTWILFHSIAENIKESQFKSQRDTLVSFIKQICENLPCPTCKQHSAPYVKQIEKIKTKEDLRQFLFYFHNEVNKRKNTRIHDYSELSKYQNVNLNTVVNSWSTVFGKRTNNSMFMTDAMHRKNIISQVYTHTCISEIS